MTYDATDSNDDGTVEADVDNEVTSSQRQSYAPKVVTNADSPFTTDGRSVYYLDSSAGPVTIELATADAENGNVLELYDVGESAGTNAITVQTEGSESINPGGNSSIQVTQSGAFVKLRNHLGNWFTDRRRQSESVTTDSIFDGQDGQAWETLREMGFESGDKVIIRDQQLNETFTTTTSTSFTSIGGRLRALSVNWDDIPNFSDGSVSVRMYVDQDIAECVFRVAELSGFGSINQTFADTEQTGNKRSFTPWHTFSTTPSGIKHYGGAFKSSDGSTEAVVRRTNIEIGVEL